jgi:hypothetical protein
MKAELVEKGIIPERFHFSTSDPLEGIIAHLTRESGANVADHGIVGITASSLCDNRYNAKYVADLTDVEHMYASKNEPNQWIEWNFETAEIERTHYSILTHTGAPGSGHMQHWVLEGRNAQEELGTLDERRDDSQLNGRGRIATFDITNRLRIRMIRLRQIGPNHDGGHILKFVVLEFLGDLFRHSA